MIFKILISIAMGFFACVELDILASSKLTNGEKISSVIAFTLIELFYLASLIVL